MVEIKRKVTLKKKTGDDSQELSPESRQDSFKQEQNKPKIGHNKFINWVIKNIIYISVILVFSVIIVYFLVSNSTKIAPQELQKIEKKSVNNSIPQDIETSDSVKSVSVANSNGTVNNSKSSTIDTENPIDNSTNNESQAKECKKVLDSSNEPRRNDSESEPSINLIDNVEKKAREVIKGTYGNGAERKNSLGSQYVSIQAKVNEIYFRNNRHF